ncbi:MAG: hypothetical protein K0Q63_1718 [Paenibacillus sp.]|nr:hypothetical protein [Paenibacillus sp.]
MEPIVHSGAAADGLDSEWKNLFEPLPKESMEAYVRKYIGLLMPEQTQKLDRKRVMKERTEKLQRAELLLTLETIIACDGNMNEMARVLFIHRNTAAYRIEKLENLLGMPLRQNDNLLRLKLALLFRDMLAGR